MKNKKPCKKEKQHKWNYYESYDYDYDKLKLKYQFRVCKKCGHAQEYRWHMTCYVWSFISYFTNVGAKQFIKGYGK
jgi:hypothetical protein